MQETPVWSLGREVPLEEGVAPTPVFLPGKTHGHRNLVGYSFMGLQRVGHNWATFIKIKTYTVQRNCCFCCLVPKLCPTLSWSHGLWSAKLLCPWDFLGKTTAKKWVAIFFSRGSSWPRDRTHISCIGMWIILPLSHQGSMKKFTFSLICSREVWDVYCLK